MIRMIRRHHNRLPIANQSLQAFLPNDTNIADLMLEPERQARKSVQCWSKYPRIFRRHISIRYLSSEKIHTDGESLQMLKIKRAVASLSTNLKRSRIQRQLPLNSILELYKPHSSPTLTLETSATTSNLTRVWISLPDAFSRPR